VIELAIAALIVAPAFRSRELEAKLPTPVTVICNETKAAGGYAVLSTRTVYLDAKVCSTLLRHKPGLWAFSTSRMPWAMAAQILYHEWWHVAFQTTDEANTDCGTRAIYRNVLRRFWGLRSRLVGLLFAEMLEGPSYVTRCK
jgi:hypothetical protein